MHIFTIHLTVEKSKSVYPRFKNMYMLSNKAPGVFIIYTTSTCDHMGDFDFFAKKNKNPTCRFLKGAPVLQHY
jgi:hypothetical protein